MSEAVADRRYGTAVIGRLTRWLTFQWALKTLGFQLFGAFIAAMLFLLVAASLVYPERTWIVVVIGFVVFTFATVTSGLQITFSTRANRFVIQVRATRHHR